jgi:GxxExxY protein
MSTSAHPDLGGDLSRLAIGAAIAVHRALGPGLEEADYERTLHLELQALGVDHEFQVPLPIVYKGTRLDAGYRLDLVLGRQLLLELKVVEKLIPVHEAQLLTYLRLSKISLGLLLNFNTLVLKDGIVRLANTTSPAMRKFVGQAPPAAFDELSREILGAALEVQHELGHGLLRSAYEACLIQELKLRGIQSKARIPVNLSYRDQLVASRKEIPMVVANEIVVSCHCAREITPLQLARDRSLLKASGFETGLVLNFHSESLVTEIRRIRSH